jgi:hypothetical protein
MRILGIDPGPTGIAWAIYGPVAGERHDRPNDIIEWGECDNWHGAKWETGDFLGAHDYAAIEWPVIFPGAGNEVRDTIATAGIWWDRLGKSTLLIPRATVASALHVRGDSRINAVVASLCPALAGVRKGLTGHHRAAAAVAYVSAGRINMPTAARRKATTPHEAKT